MSATISLAILAFSTVAGAPTATVAATRTTSVSEGGSGLIPPAVGAVLPGPADSRLERRGFGLDLSLEYRVIYQNMHPLSLNDLSASRVSYFEQRGRAGARARLGDSVRIVLLTDILDGVLFGDNGSFDGTPKRNRGSEIAAKSPNLARLGIDRLSAGGSSLDPASYGLVLVPADVLTLRELYGEALLPIGLLRAGRQPLVAGRSVLVHEGTRINRWGVSRSVDAVDAIAFGTKLSAIKDLIDGRPIDADPGRGLFFGTLLGVVVQNRPEESARVLQWAATTFYRAERTEVFGFDARRLRAGAIYSLRAGDRFDAQLHTVIGYLELELERIRLISYNAQLFGRTREVSESLALLGTSSGPPAVQTIRSFGGFAELAYLAGLFELSFEVYYASGNDDPRSTSPLTQVTLAEDTNVGLHLFKNVVAYQTARSARLAVANLASLHPPTLPVAEVDTRGGLQNAVVLFPQVIATPLPWLALRGGVMFAFAQTRVVDPIRTVLAAGGRPIPEVAMNYNGGSPGNYWGTEIDLGATLIAREHFAFDLEGAYLFPGNALKDANGDAVNSIFGTARFTFFYDSP